MRNYPDGRSGQPCGVHNGGVNQLVENNGVAPGNEGADRADCRGVTGGECERGLRVFEGGERVLEVMMWPERAANKA